MVVALARWLNSFDKGLVSFFRNVFALKIKELNFKNKRCSTGNFRWWTCVSICILCFNGEGGNFTLGHCDHTKIPSFDDFLLSQVKDKLLITIATWIELSTVFQSSDIMLRKKEIKYTRCQSFPTIFVHIFTKSEKYLWKLVYILAKQRKSPFNLTDFNDHKF